MSLKGFETIVAPALFDSSNDNVTAMASVLSPPYYSHHAPNPNGGNHGVSGAGGPALTGGHSLYGGTDTKLNSHL